MKIGSEGHIYSCGKPIEEAVTVLQEGKDGCPEEGGCCGVRKT